MAGARVAMESPVKLTDVARLAGVHPATASRALNVRTRGLVNRETAKRVLSAAADLGYRPNRIARGLKTNRSYTVGVLIPDLTNPLFPPMLRGIEDRLQEAEYTTLIANTDNQPEREALHIETMRARQVDAIITATAHGHHPAIDELGTDGMPVVLLNRWLPDLAVSSAAPDDRVGQRLAVEHLIDLGHRRIAYLAGPEDLSTGFERRAGFIEAMRRAGQEQDQSLVGVGAWYSVAEGVRLTRQLLDSERDFTAIAAANDLFALAALDLLAERGLGCPEKVSVVGFNDMPFAARFQPPLTTIRISHYEMGAAAADLVLERLHEPDAEIRHLRLEPTLVIRESTGPPDSSAKAPS
jgi:LacI family transcriptional regulator